MSETDPGKRAALPADVAAAHRKRNKRIASGVVSLVVVVVIFALIIPKIADYSEVWKTLQDLTPLELAACTGAMVLNLITYWLQMMAALPGLTLGQAAVVNQTTTTVANIVPAGGAVAIGLTFGILRSWGFTYAAATLEQVVTGIWNIFLKLGLPIVALAILAIQGDADAGLVAAAFIGLAVLLTAIVLFGLMLWKRALARSIGSGLGRLAASFLKLLRKPPATDWGERAVRFRRDTIGLLAGRWLWLTLTTIASHLALYFVLVVCLRSVGVSEREIGAVEILGVFSFVRLISALPITPGGVGVVELGLIGGLAALAPDVSHAQIAAGSLLFRALTYGIQIPLGGFTYVIWRVKKSWMKEPPEEPEPKPLEEAEVIEGMPAAIEAAG